MKQKAKSERAHFRRRMLERFGLVVSRELMRAICEAIQGGRAHSVARATNRLHKHAICYDGHRFVVVYDKSRKELVTVLPQEDPAYTSTPWEHVYELEGNY